jgi:hypothetical protein
MVVPCHHRCSQVVDVGDSLDVCSVPRIADNRQGGVLQLGGWAWSCTPFIAQTSILQNGDCNEPSD